MEGTIIGQRSFVPPHDVWGARVSGLCASANLNTLSQAKTFASWLFKKGWVKVRGLFDGIEVPGERRRGKPQLTEDESKQFLGLVLERGRAGDRGAVASACALLLGMRATEIADRIVRDLDAGGTKLNITKAKTRAGIRTMKVPTVLQPLLQELARGKQPGDRLFGDADRYWVRREVRRLCKLANVPIVPPHGLRGTHGRLAVEAGISGDVVAASLGHESFADRAPIQWTVSLRCLSCLPFCKGLEDGRRLAAEGRVTTPAVVEDLDVLVDGVGGFSACRPATTVNEFALQGPKEALDDGVVPAVPSAAEAALDAV
jgi:Phage integrase family